MRKLIVSLDKKSITFVKSLIKSHDLSQGEYILTDNEFVLFYKHPYTFADVRFELFYKGIKYIEVEMTT